MARVAGVLIDGQAAYALSRVLDEQDIAERLAEAGYAKWAPRALAVINEIHVEGEAWARVARRQAQRGSASGPVQRESVPKQGSMPEPGPSLTVMSVTEAANALHVSPGYVRRLARNGELPGRRNGRDWELDAAAVAARAASNGTAGSPAGRPCRGTR